MGQADRPEPDADGFLDVLYAPAALMLIRRVVFLALMRRFPELHCRACLQGRDEHDVGARASLHCAFFDTKIDAQMRFYLSGDQAFCQRIGSIGIAPVVDTRSNFTHQGGAVFQGDLRAVWNCSVSPVAGMRSRV